MLPAQGTVLEIASGTGQHAVHFAAALPGIDWQPSDPDPGHRESIARWIGHERARNVLPPLDLDVCIRPWPVEHAAAVVCINMIHISPWEATLSLLGGAGHLLARGGVLFLYGPYRRGGAHTAPSNAAFDDDLRGRNPAWGIRDLEAVERCALAEGFAPAEVIAMPANNFSLVFRRTGG